MAHISLRMYRDCDGLLRASSAPVSLTTQDRRARDRWERSSQISQRAESRRQLKNRTCLIMRICSLSHDCVRSGARVSCDRARSIACSRARVVPWTELLSAALSRSTAWPHLARRLMDPSQARRSLAGQAHASWSLHCVAGPRTMPTSWLSPKHYVYAVQRLRFSLAEVECRPASLDGHATRTRDLAIAVPG